MALTLTVTTRFSSGITLAWSGAGANDTQFQVEVNRAEDFASDDSLTATYPGSSVTLGGMPASTPWWCRVRPVGGAWSNVILTSTFPVALNTTYTGFSIGKALMVIPESIANLTAIGLIAGYPISNLKRDDPASTARFATGTFTIDFDTAGVPIDVIALLGTLANDTAQWRITGDFTAANRGTGGAYDSGFVSFRCSPTLGVRTVYHALQQLDAPSSASYWRITVNHSAPQFIIRNLVVGLARKSVNPSKGLGSSSLDQGNAQRTRFGTADRAYGWRGRAVDFEMSWIKEAEFQAKWSDMMTRVGRTLPVLAIPNSARNVHLNDRIAYGFMTAQHDENVQSFYHTKTVEIDSIY